ncbi:PREDICTED: filamin-interacting protein FAM101B isoform X2 [Lepidothrix coronata]|uniref:Filamin-interacting protein FAM101B isoform X2 n=1 Tax=Lepidothrix coronata TaxID=321398 RepID=A0A6J0HRP3_9PASS|nr:PREDICTED: filamin-interacting protein FAM101B isoform X2 [Lepidothrix coronata]
MVGRLSLREVPDLPDMRKRGDSGLDSPDSGLPPSPGPAPPPWLLSSGSPDRAAANGLPEPDPPAPSAAVSTGPAAPRCVPGCPPRLCPLSFGEGVEFDPLPPKEIRYTSSVRYDSEKHFIDDVYMPVGLSVSSCSQTVICVPNCTWRSYKSEVHFEPRNKPRRFTSTTIIYPKHAKTVYTTTLDYNCRKTTRRFLSSIELETSECLGNDCVLDGC